MMRIIRKFIAASLSALMLVSVGTMGAFAATVTSPKLKAVNAVDGVKLSWNKGTGASKFLIERRLSGTTQFVTLGKAGASAVSYVDKTAKSGKVYSYKVSAINGNAAAVGRKTIRYLAAPTSLKVTIIKKSYGNAAKLTWSKSGSATKYRVYRAKVSGSKTGKFIHLDTVKKTKYVDSYAGGAYYKYKVAAATDHNKSALSRASAKSMYLDSPMITIGKNSSYTGFEISWYPVTGAKKYSVYKSAAGGKYKLLVSSSGFKKKKNEFVGKTFYHVDKNVKFGTTYNYYVVAEAGKIKSAVIKETTGKEFRDYDIALSLGKNNNFFTQLLDMTVNVYKSTDIDLTLSSSDANVLKITKNTDANGYTKFDYEGVSEGYAYLNMKLSYNLGEETMSEKMRIKVTSEPQYDVNMKVGDVSYTSDLTLSDSLSDLGSQVMSLISSSVTFTASDPNVLKVTKDSKGYKVRAVSEGACDLIMKFDLSNVPVESPQDDYLKYYENLRLTLSVCVKK